MDCAVIFSHINIKKNDALRLFQTYRRMIILKLNNVK